MPEGRLGIARRRPLVSLFRLRPSALRPKPRSRGIPRVPYRRRCARMPQGTLEPELDVCHLRWRNSQIETAKPAEHDTQQLPHQVGRLLVSAPQGLVVLFVAVQRDEDRQRPTGGWSPADRQGSPERPTCVPTGARCTNASGVLRRDAVLSRTPFSRDAPRPFRRPRAGSPPCDRTPRRCIRPKLANLPTIGVHFA